MREIFPFRGGLIVILILLLLLARSSFSYPLATCHPALATAPTPDTGHPTLGPRLLRFARLLSTYFHFSTSIAVHGGRFSKPIDKSGDEGEHRATFMRKLRQWLIVGLCACSLRAAEQTTNRAVAGLSQLPGLRRLMETPLRDTSICRGPDGTWYLTGTVQPFWAYNQGIKVWRSKDLNRWEPLGFVWKYGESPWHKKYFQAKKPLWAPEIHYLRSTFWLTYSMPGWDGTAKTSGSGLLKSTTGMPEGPYQDVQPSERLGDEIDASLFEDDDGSVYFLWHSGKIARMKPDLSGLAEPYHWLKTTTSDPNPKHHSRLCAGIFGTNSFDHVGYEGMFLFKANGRYYLSCSEEFDGRYSCAIATATNIYGPYGERYEAIPHAGHNMFFRDDQGQWWSTYFGSDQTAPWRERPGLLPVTLDPAGRVCFSAVPGASERPTRGETAKSPEVTRVQASNSRFARPWQVTMPRASLLAAWERLKQLDIPGIPLDQHFHLEGSAFYVSPNGDDSAPGSKDHPWQTLPYAVAQFKPGMVIYLMAGTYYGPVVIKTKATEHSPVALRALAGEEVIVTYDDAFVRQQQARIAKLGQEGAVDANGQQLHYPSLITIVGTYVEVSGLHLIGVRDRLPMNLYSESGISIAGGGGLGCRVLDNEIQNTGHCGVKEMGHGGKRFLIEGNYIYDLGHTAHDHAIYLPADDVVIRRNLLLNTAGWGIHAYTEPKRLTISHNVIGGNAEDAIILGGAECRVLHNLLYHDRHGGVFLFRRGCRNNTIANNIILEPAAFRFDAAGSAAPADQPQENVLDYNCLVCQSSTASRFNSMGAHNILAEPGLVDAAALDFRLQPGSVCIDAGDPQFLERFYGKAPDIGPYESR